MRTRIKAVLALTALCAASAAVLLIRKKTPPRLNVSLLEKAVTEKLPDSEITSIVEAQEKGCYLVEMNSGGEKYQAFVCIIDNAYNITNIRKAAQENGLYEGV